MNKPSKPIQPSGQAGSSIAETLIAVALATIGITSLCVANANCLNIARSHRELLIADQCLQQRAEQFRAASWTLVTDPNGVVNLLNTAPVGLTSQLQDQTEVITISAYPPVVPAAAPIAVTRTGTGTATLTSTPPSGLNLRASLAVRIDFQENWTSAQGKRPRSRETSTVVVLGGLLH